MFLFSVTATAKKDVEGVNAGQQAEFIVYIDYKDQQGAIQLCKFYLANAGFGQVIIDKMKEAHGDFIKNSVSSAHRSNIEAAQSDGYFVQLFEQ
ncbi:hypothetical protein EDC56_0099 [Sinobacterium caligoides]|uniref:Uncharacterized protein n=1 Tax=Sinobacterium caligoides TaxID=933926 RepID=A0A3N2DXN6_9GAMM|nr:hypothetical protein [Sinobacterium caligoides]ROS04593.1 hypothetical protein EDC56_0099 [Sinobacterium caligoides]